MLSILKKASPNYLHNYADDAAVALFSEQMKRKLKCKRKQGYGEWYTDDCTIENLRSMLNKNLEDGDMVDVANLAMMIACKEAIKRNWVDEQDSI